jgi:hypothetical protein
MAAKHTELSEELIKFIRQQRVFFVGTGAADGRVNVSPKGMDSLRVLGKNRVVWLNLTGSGNETAAHVMEHDRMTLMFCAFEGPPLILRLYGHARAIHPKDSEWQALISMFPPSLGARQLFDMEIDLVQTSCGKGVPLYEYTGERGHMLNEFYEKKGPAGMAEYWRTRNRESIDGKPTGIVADEDTTIATTLASGGAKPNL